MSDEKQEPLSQDQIDILANQAALETVTALIMHKNETFMITDPKTVSAHIKGKGYGYAPHVGGETFKLSGSFATDGDCIFKFTPEEASTYSWIELNLRDAQGMLSGFSSALENTNWKRLVHEARIKIVDAEREKLEEERQQTYNNYGSW